MECSYPINNMNKKKNLDVNSDVSESSTSYYKKEGDCNEGCRDESKCNCSIAVASTEKKAERRKHPTGASGWLYGCENSWNSSASIPVESCAQPYVWSYYY